MCAGAFMHLVLTINLLLETERNHPVHCLPTDPKSVFCEVMQIAVSTSSISTIDTYLNQNCFFEINLP